MLVLVDFLIYSGLDLAAELGRAEGDAVEEGGLRRLEKGDDGEGVYPGTSSF